MNSRLLLATALVASFGNMSGEASAEVELFFDYSPWQSAMGATTTIGFADLPGGTFVTTQYADLGVLFTDGLDQVQCCGGFGTYPQDGAGLNGVGPVELLFTQPMHGIATHYPGNIIFELYDGDALIYESVELGIGGPDNFAGLISNQSFDRAILRKPGDLFMQIDNLYFGPPVPGPAALPVLAWVAWMRVGSRRRPTP